MLTTKKISPTEFRLHNKLFYVDYSPSNYFEKFRFELIFQNLIMWFFNHYGVYFYIQKLKLLDDKILFQLYFYKTYLVKRFINYTKLTKTGIATEKYQDLEVEYLALKSVKYLKYYNIKLYKIVKKVRFKLIKAAVKPPQKKRIKKAIKPIYNNDKPRWQRNQQFTRSKFPAQQRNQQFTRSKFPAQQRIKRFSGPRFPFQSRIMIVKTPKVLPSISYNFFFTYFFMHFFKYTSIILYKSLYKTVFANSVLLLEHRDILFKTRYLQNYKWSYDFLFLLNYAITFANTNFLFPFLVYHMTRKYRQIEYITILFNVLRQFYFYKATIKGIQILVHGPYDRHGRTRTFVSKLGDLKFIEYKSLIFYDSIQCPTLYGTINIKLWIQYVDYDK